MKAASARAKGMRAEAQARDYLRANGHPFCERIPAGAEADRGDLSGVAGGSITTQVKHYADVARACREGMHDALAQQERAGTPFAAVIVRPPGCVDPSTWRVVMSLQHFALLTSEATK